jgi:RNA polymerase sigma factor (TIGR02999 family)
MEPTERVRQLLAGVRNGSQEDREALLRIVYDDLRRIARRHLRGRQTGTLGTTALVNEAYLRLAGRGGGAWQDRAHFLAVASVAMRHVLVDNARRKQAQRRGGGVAPVQLEDHHGGEQPRVEELLELDQALTRLAALDEHLARVVELRFFGDLSMEEVAEVLGVSDRTVRRDWRKARSFLHDQLRDH